MGLNPLQPPAERGGRAARTEFPSANAILLATSKIARNLPRDMRVIGVCSALFMVLLWIGLLAAWPDLGAQARSLLPFGHEAAPPLAGNGTKELTGASTNGSHCQRKFEALAPGWLRAQHADASGYMPYPH